MTPNMQEVVRAFAEADRAWVRADDLCRKAAKVRDRAYAIRAAAAVELRAAVAFQDREREALAASTK